MKRSPSFGFELFRKKNTGYKEVTGESGAVKRSDQLGGPHAGRKKYALYTDVRRKSYVQ